MSNNSKRLIKKTWYLLEINHNFFFSETCWTFMKQKKMIYTRAAIFFVIILFIRSFESQIGLFRVYVFVFVVLKDWRFSGFYREFSVLAVNRMCGSTKTQHRLYYEIIRWHFNHQVTATDSKWKQTVGCVYYLHLTERHKHRFREWESQNIHEYIAKQRDVYHFIKTLYARARSI